MFAAPLAFLLAATIVVALVRSGMRDDRPASPKPAPTKTEVTKVRPAAPAAGRTYTVRAGDTLASISASTGVSVARLQELNPKLEPTSLFIGDKIRLR